MLTVEELDNIEKWLDDAGMPAGLYREGYRACIRDAMEFTKTKAFGEMVQQEFSQALVKIWAEAMMHDFFGKVQRAFGGMS